MMTITGMSAKKTSYVTNEYIMKKSVYYKTTASIIFLSFVKVEQI